MADILTLDEYKAASGIPDMDTRNDAKIAALLPMLTSAINSFTSRDFGAPTVTEERVYDYDSSGYIDIDDAAEITQVAFVIPNSSTDFVLPSDAWAAHPTRRDDTPVFYYILVGPAYGVGSPEMGFARNLDVYYRERGPMGATALVKVTGTWGWPSVPADVKLAAIWTLQDWISKPLGDNLTSESIEGYARSWGGRQGATIALAVPNRARDLLANYQKLDI